MRLKIKLFFPSITALILFWACFASLTAEAGTTGVEAQKRRIMKINNLRAGTDACLYTPWSPAGPSPRMVFSCRCRNSTWIRCYSMIQNKPIESNQAQELTYQDIDTFLDTF